MAAPEVPLAPLPATPLPEIAVRELEPTPLAERIPVPMPSVATLVPEPRAIATTPQVSVAAPAPVPLPSVAAQVEAAAPVPIPAPTVATTPARPVSIPDVQASVGAARDVRVTPQVRVAPPRRCPRRASRPRSGTPAAGPERADRRRRDGGHRHRHGVAARRRGPAGGDAANPGQTGPLVDPAATSQGAGAAASPERQPGPDGFARGAAAAVRAAARATARGARRQRGRRAHERRALRVDRDRDAGGGGLTRLMLVFDRTDPERVGPVRSAREYFVELAARLDAVLVHDGGSPGALAAIAASTAADLQRLHQRRAVQPRRRPAPYNLFTAGDALRAAVNRLDLARGRTVTGTIFRPAEDAPAASRRCRCASAAAT
jgi:hypothetical protein